MIRSLDAVPRTGTCDDAGHKRLGSPPRGSTLPAPTVGRFCGIGPLLYTAIGRPVSSFSVVFLLVVDPCQRVGTGGSRATAPSRPPRRKAMPTAAPRPDEPELSSV